MDDLIARLRAALDETERIALAAVRFDYGVASWADDGDPVNIHIALHDPERELRMVAAHRNILDLHQGNHTCAAWGDGMVDSYATILDGDICATVLAVAGGYGIVAA